MTLYEIVDHFVKPWTQNTGNSIALLMNCEKPLKAEVMISHAWGEDIIEAMVALLGKAYAMKMPLTTVVWFCLCSIGGLLQGGRVNGPSVVERRLRTGWGCRPTSSSMCVCVCFASFVGACAQPCWNISESCGARHTDRPAAARVGLVAAVELSGGTRPLLGGGLLRGFCTGARPWQGIAGERRKPWAESVWAPGRRPGCLPGPGGSA